MVDWKHYEELSENGISRLAGQFVDPEEPSLLGPDAIQRQYTLVRRRVVNALRSCGEKKLADRIEKCSPRKRCRTFYCQSCRNRVSDNLAHRMLNYLSRDHILRLDPRTSEPISNEVNVSFIGRDGDLVSLRKKSKWYKSYGFDLPGSLASHLRKWKKDYVLQWAPRAYSDVKFVTGLVAVCPLNEAEIRGQIMWARRLFRRLVNTFPDFWIEGSFELELVNLGKVLNCSVGHENQNKIRQIRGLSGLERNVLFPEADDVRVLLHWHALIVGLGTERVRRTRRRGRPRKGVDSEFIEVPVSPLSILKKHYNRVPGQLHVQPLRKDQSPNNAIRKLSSYPFKNVYRYKYTHTGSDYANGEYFTNQELARLVMIQDKIRGGRGYKGLLIYNKGIKALPDD